MTIAVRCAGNGRVSTRPLRLVEEVVRDGVKSEREEAVDRAEDADEEEECGEVGRAELRDEADGPTAGCSVTIACVGLDAGLCRCVLTGVDATSAVG